MHACIHTYMCVCACKYIHTYMHTYLHTYVCGCVCIHMSYETHLYQKDQFEISLYCLNGKKVCQSIILTRSVHLALVRC